MELLRLKLRVLKAELDEIRGDVVVTNPVIIAFFKACPDEPDYTPRSEEEVSAEMNSLQLKLSELEAKLDVDEAIIEDALKDIRV